MQEQRRGRLLPILKKVALVFAVKKGIDMYHDAQQPPKRSIAGRAAKVGLWLAGGAGIFYAFVSGKLQPVVDRVMGASPPSSGNSQYHPPVITTEAPPPTASSASTGSSPEVGKSGAQTAGDPTVSGLTGVSESPATAVAGTSESPRTADTGSGSEQGPEIGTKKPRRSTGKTGGEKPAST